ncbi:hypothetical protein EV359DRAFT_65401 [Lentinula novae-zelandiae]|nr:hypothetical protein EV359DRAFT_65401 [Lentinula novae-zelandiae]
MGVVAIANAEFGSDFFRKNWGDDFTTHFCYVDRNSEEFNPNLFGEILGEAHGTSGRVRGNHFSGNNPQAITDLTKTRCNIVLGCPSHAPSHMKDLWHNQLCTLRSITNCDKQQDMSGAEMTKVDNGFDTIILTGGLMYTSGNNDDDHDRIDKHQSNLKKRSITSLQTVDEGSSEQNMDCMCLQYPNSGDIEVGATYDYRLMPDFGSSCLVQPNWLKLDGLLITPWKNYLHLGTGTLVIVNISIRMHMLRPKSKKQPTCRVYQAIINFLKVVAESDVPVACPSPPRIGKSASIVSSGRSAAASMLQSIGSTGSLLSEPGMSGTMVTGNISQQFTHPFFNISTSGITGVEVVG